MSLEKSQFVPYKAIPLICLLVDTGLRAPPYQTGHMAPIQEMSCRIYISQRQKNTQRKETEIRIHET